VTPTGSDPLRSTLEPRVCGTVLAFDFGARRVGVAVGDLALGIAHPLETLRVASDGVRLDEVARLIRDWSPALLVVGLPSHLNGAKHELSDRCRRFALQLERRFGVKVRLVDERLTSRAAAQSLAAAGVRGQRQRQMLDQVAAVHILQTFFTAR